MHFIIEGEGPEVVKHTPNRHSVQQNLCLKACAVLGTMSLRVGNIYVLYVIHVVLYGTASCTWPQTSNREVVESGCIRDIPNIQISELRSSWGSETVHYGSKKKSEHPGRLTYAIDYTYCLYHTKVVAVRHLSQCQKGAVNEVIREGSSGQPVA